MSGNISLCSFCRFIPLDVATLEKLRSKARPRPRLGGPRPVPLDGTRKTELAVGSRAVFALGKAERVLSSDCPFCKITAIAVRDIKRATHFKELEADTPLSLTWSREGPSSMGVFKVNDKDDTYICFVDESCTGPSTQDMTRSSACMIRPTQAQLEPSTVERWVTDCERFHGPECNAHTGIADPIRDIYRQLELMRFVDVHEMCIVERREVVKYVALSYVWGAVASLRLTTMNQREMSTPGTLSALLLPPTILHAIQLTRACGQQYLWVDALCIMQNDVEDVEAGTNAMDLIYEMSVFTIVAACGSDARYGLPGFKVGSRLAPQYIEVSQGVRLGVLSEVDQLVHTSCYATRGWTFQEEMLSKRILYFVENKVFFHCPEMTQSEDCPVPLRWMPRMNLPPMLYPFRDYKDLIARYSMRILTTQNDALRAMSGIIRRISDHQQWDIIEGMPTVALESMMLFRWGLYPLSRRHGFPSYSWLGWKGRLKFMKGLHVFDCWINWHVRDPATGEILPVERRPMFPNSDTRARGIDASNGIATQINPDFGLLPGVRINQGFPLDRTTKLSFHPNFPLLCFSTLAVFFAIDRIKYTSGTATVWNPEGTQPELEVGAVTLDGLDEYPVSRQGEFILLSKTIPSDDDGELLDLLTRKEMYAVMLIEWRRNGVAERRGIGFIDCNQVKNSLTPGPVWKEIVLG